MSGMSSVMKKDILVLGVGNLLQCDDGVGIHLIRRMRENGEALPEYVELYDGATAGLDLMPVMEGRRHLIVVDALAADDRPGSIYRFTPESAESWISNDSMHELGILEALSLLELRGAAPECTVVGIVPADTESWSMELSGEVAAALPTAMDLVHRITLELGGIDEQ